MARTIVSRFVDTEIEGTRFLAIARFLRDDAGAEERAKGGLWVKADDAEMLAQVGAVALEFAAACDARLRALADERKPAPKAQRKPTQAPKPEAPKPEAVKANRAIALAAAGPDAPKPARAMCDASTHADNAQAGAKFCPLCGTDLSALARKAAVETARANKPAPTPRVSAPTPAPTPAKKAAALTADDYERLIG